MQGPQFTWEEDLARIRVCRVVSELKINKSIDGATAADCKIFGQWLNDLILNKKRQTFNCARKKRQRGLRINRQTTLGAQDADLEIAIFIWCKSKVNAPNECLIAHQRQMTKNITVREGALSDHLIDIQIELSGWSIDFYEGFSGKQKLICRGEQCLVRASGTCASLLMQIFKNVALPLKNSFFKSRLIESSESPMV